MKVVEARFPLAPKRLEPIVDGFEGQRPKPAWAPLRIAAALDKTGALQDLEVLGDGRLR